MPDLRPLPSRLDGIEDYLYTSEHGRRRLVRRVAIADPVVWRETERVAQGAGGQGYNAPVLLNSAPATAAHYERLRAGLSS